MTTIRNLFLCLLFCLTSAHAAEPRRMTWNVGGVQREALVFAPTSNAPGETHPLIFAFHGHGGNMQGTSKWGLQNRWPQAIVVYPQGLLTPSNLDPKGHHPGWQRLPGDQGDRDLKFVDAMLASMRQEFRVDDKRIFATGFSNGAFFSFLLWIERTRTFAAYAIVAGSLLPEQHLPAAAPVLHIAGKTDPKVTPEKVEPTVVEERRANNATGEGQKCGPECTLYHGNADVKVVWHPGGHMYPPMAAQLTVEFFQAVTYGK